MMSLWFAIFMLPFCLSVYHSSIFRKQRKSDLEKPFCNVEAKVPSDTADAYLMSAFGEIRQLPMVSQESLQAEALKCIDDFYGEGCDSTLALNYTKTSNQKVASSAASHYGERLKKSSGLFGCSCKEYYVDGPKLRNEFFVGTLYCVFASTSSQEHGHHHNGEKYISVAVGSTLAIWNSDHGPEAIFLSTGPGPTGEESPKSEKEVAVFSSTAKPPTDLEKDLTDDMVQELWVALTDTGVGIADYVEADYWLGVKAKDLLIKELKIQHRFARFEWVGQSTKQAMFSELLPNYIYTVEDAVDSMLENCEPYIVYNVSSNKVLAPFHHTVFNAFLIHLKQRFSL